MSQYRIERLGQEIRQKIGALIVEGRIKDNRVNPFLSITKAEVSKDLSYADIYVSDIRGKNIEKGVEGLQSAAGFIQSQLNRTMHIRKTPRLRFHADISIGEGFKMVKKLEELVQAETSDKVSND
ncbi:MAG TPA: 30S ribosome-binding factor RbfA [Clostridiales bacterium]|nr:30S ribosome-binding factor RbfA [Clostridiales bacterium]